MAGGVIMLSDHVERYIALRRALGFKLSDPARNLRDFARFAAARGDTRIRTVTAMAWAELAGTSHTRHVRLRDVTGLARFLRAEDQTHEVPPTNPFPALKTRTLPYIYTPDELARIIASASRLRVKNNNPLRPKTYALLFGLIAATGMRISEALNLRIDDVLPGGVLRIRKAKFGKSRLIPLHQTVINAVNDFLEIRRRMATITDHVFLSAENRPLSIAMADYTFRRILLTAAIVPQRARPPRIHDLRHTFATRALEKCSTQRHAVGRHFVALATYLGHADIAHTYWYLEATPDLMTDMAAAARAFVAGEDREDA